MKIQKFSPFFFALQSVLVPSGKILAQYYYHDQKLFIQLENERAVFEEAYLVAYDKKNSQFIALQELNRESSDIYSITFHDDFLSSLVSVKYVRLCLATYKNEEYVYSYLNSPDINEDNYSICDAYIETIKFGSLENSSCRLILYYSEAGALSIKPITDNSEFEKYLAPQLVESYVDSQKLYFTITCVSSYTYNFSLNIPEEKRGLDLRVENRESFVRNLEHVTVSCEMEKINTYRQNDFQLLYQEKDDIFEVNGVCEKTIKFLYNDHYYFLKIENSRIGKASISVMMYNFTVVLSADSEKSLLKATIHSIQNQDIDFEESFQIVLYGEGQTEVIDYIQELKQLYPVNIYFVPEEKSSNLENVISVCLGKYVTFAIAGDIFSPQTFSSSYKFLEKNKTVIDAAGINIFSQISEGQKVADNFNEKGDIISFFMDYQKSPLLLRGLFIKNSVLEKMISEKLTVQDDVACLIWALFDKKTFGKIPDCASIVLADNALEDLFSPEMFFSAVDRMNLLIGEIMEKGGYIPYHCQRILAARLALILESLEPIMDEYNHPDYNFEQEWQSVSDLLRNVEDKVIMELETSRFKKLFLLDLKHKGRVHIEYAKNNWYVMYDNTLTYRVERFITRIDLMQISDGNLIIEGNCHVPISLFNEDFYIYAVINNERCSVIQVNRDADRFFLDKAYLRVSGFKIVLPLAKASYKIQIYNYFGGYECEKKNLEFMKMCPVGTELQSSYYYNDGYMVTTNGTTIFCSKCLEEERIEQEKKFQNEIKKLDEKHAEEIISLRNFYWNNIHIKTSKIWLVTDRPDRADDNGEAFFRYMEAHPKENIDCSFILKKGSEKYEELKEIGNIVEPYSMEHKQMHLLADYIISSQMSESANNPFDKQYVYFRDLYRRNKFIFLQHGVIHNHHGRVLGKYSRDFYGLVASAAREAEYFISPRFNYTNKEVWLTGLPRFDRLYHDEKKIITIMPTWRKYLTIRAYDSSIGTLNWIVKDNFAESEYFKFFNHLINDERLLSVAEEYGYKICFMPHITFLHQTGLFHKDSRVEIYEYEKSYREIYAESNLIVTDYSSAVFDFAYLQKPILYCQFDQKDFWTKHTVKKGYWNFEEDGFGEVSYDLDTLVNLIIEYIKSGCVLKDIYRKRIQEFFAYIDQNCCERIVNRIFALEETD